VVSASGSTPASYAIRPATAAPAKPQANSAPAAPSAGKQPTPIREREAVSRPPREMLEKVLSAPVGAGPVKNVGTVSGAPAVKAKAFYCVECSSNTVLCARNVSEPLPIASITKLLTAMTVMDLMDLNAVVEVSPEIRETPKHRVGIRPGDLITVSDLLHGMLIASGNDCAEAVAGSYRNGGRAAFVRAMNRKAESIGACSSKVYTPSGLDAIVTVGRKEGRNLTTRTPNSASASDVALIAKHAFKYPLIARIAAMKQHTMVTHNEKPRKYMLATNDRLLFRPLPLAGAKTGYTDLAGKCIVAMFKDEEKARDYMVVVLNTANHFIAAEKIFRWASKAF
jgi:D-alanyl-D-alanine carboxypeptidase